VKKTALFLSLLSSVLYADNKYSVAVTNEVIFSQFSSQDGTHEGVPDLLSVKLNRSFDGLNIFAKYSKLVSPIHFAYSVDAETINGAQQFVTPIHLDEEYLADYSSISVGIDVRQDFYGLDLDFAMSVGSGSFGARFVKGLEAIDNYDGSISYHGSNMVTDVSLGVNKQYGDVGFNLNAGYLFATSGDGGMRADRDYDIVSGMAGPEITKGSSIQGKMDFSGFKLGFGISLGF